MTVEKFVDTPEVDLKCSEDAREHATLSSDESDDSDEVDFWSSGVRVSLGPPLNPPPTKVRGSRRIFTYLPIQDGQKPMDVSDVECDRPRSAREQTVATLHSGVRCAQGVVEVCHNKQCSLQRA